MTDIGMEWLRSVLGATGLVLVVWLAISCVFSIMLARLMARLQGSGSDSPARPDLLGRRGPRGVRPEPSAARLDEREKPSAG